MAEGTDIQKTFTAVILAGDRGSDDPVARAAGLAHKYLVPVAGEPMLQRVVQTLSDSPWIGRILVVLEDPSQLSAIPGLAAALDSGRLAGLAATPSPSRSVLKAAEALAKDFPLLITTADHPLLDAEMIDCFCRESLAANADVSIGLTAATLLQARFPRSRRTYLRFRDDGYSGSNLLAFLTSNGLEAARFWRRAEDERKRPWRLASLFGARLLLAYLLRRYSLAQAMTQISARLDIRVAAVTLPFATAAIDVDKPADLELVEEILRDR